ncbi:MAG: fatty acid desaturase [Burkholderiaceae bacterium]|jgi:stearoyl-CoA desaturase (delta-9 desaturase)|nr:fatty acid desaturase [Aquabacterium sp.]NUP85906.1 fatty acid desaturase [Burkholderiaceae bacterium]
MTDFAALWFYLVDAAAHGLWRSASVWTWVAYTLALTHVTIAAVTIFLHRSQAHRALDLHPLPAHFFRFWLWLTTGMVTREWVAIHRKHHARCETTDDPHSPVSKGIRTVLSRGSELYREEARNAETLSKYGRNTPDDWLERHVYARYTWQGVGLMLVIDLVLFGVIGLTVWAVQMLWIPVCAAGIINGIGHYKGYRSFESADASTNVVPWGIVIGGEELHNNHHTYPTSAKLSVKPFEFDIAWGYIRALELLGLARVRKTVPQLRRGPTKPVADAKTLEAVIANRYEVMARYASALRQACAAELRSLKIQGVRNAARLNELRLARRWLPRDAQKIPPELRACLDQVVAASPHLAKLLSMREELCQIWTRTNASAEQLVAELQAWCRKAEASGIVALENFSLTLRAARM